MIKCPKCGGNTRVSVVRPYKDELENIRQRKCLKCGFLFCTREYVIDYAQGLELIALWGRDYWRKTHGLETRRDYEASEQKV